MAGAFGSGIGYQIVPPDNTTNPYSWSLNQNKNISTVLDTVSGIANTVTKTTDKVVNIADKIGQVSSTVAKAAEAINELNKL
jgi:methyl-accepting chemotaxis protein